MNNRGAVARQTYRPIMALKCRKRCRVATLPSEIRRLWGHLSRGSDAMTEWYLPSHGLEVARPEVSIAPRM